MEEITMKYGQFKARMDTEMQEAAEGFVRIGYLLKVARDTSVLAESGYKTVAEFAQAEYGLTKDIVSRYIAINDRFAENGYSDSLKEKYQNIGVSKLGEMLTLSDEVIEAIPLNASRREIQEIKREIHEEKEITDLEVMMEGENSTQEMMTSILERFLHQYIHDNFRELRDLVEACRETEERRTDRILDVLAPSGVGMKMARIPGSGRYMLSIKGKNEPLELLNVRTNEKESYSWEELQKSLISLLGNPEPEECWKDLFDEPYPAHEKAMPKEELPAGSGMEKVVPVQHGKEAGKEVGREQPASQEQVNGAEGQQGRTGEQQDDPSKQQEKAEEQLNGPGRQQEEILELKETDHPDVVEDLIYQIKKEALQHMRQLQEAILAEAWKEAGKVLEKLDWLLEQLDPPKEDDIEGQRTIEEYIHEAD